MPDGKTHSAITAVAAGVITVSLWRAGFTGEEVRLAATGCLTGIVLSPDLDVDGGFLGHVLVTKYLGKIVGTIWRVFWWPYAVLAPHRSWMSHAPLISTLLRLGYCYGTYFVVCAILQVPAWVPEPHMALYSCSGLVVSDTLHYIADIISTYLKRRRHASLHIPMSEVRTRRRSRTQV